MRQVRAHIEFSRDLDDQLQWLADNAQPSWIENVINGMRWIVNTIGTFPGIGRPLARRGPFVLRSLRYPKGPYAAWYVNDDHDPDADVVLVRMFHQSQDRADPDLSRWLGPP